MKSGESKFLKIGKLVLLIVIQSIGINPILAQQPDARFWYDDVNYCCGNGYVDLYVGGPPQFVTADDDHDPCVSFQVFSPNVAIKITVLDVVRGKGGPQTGEPGGPYELFIYSEVSQPNYFGTNQYCGRNLKIECIPANMPEPSIFVPVDRLSVHPDADNSPLWPWTPSHKMLVLRKAFFWENSEDLGDFHGPYGAIGISVCSQALGTWSYDDFLNNWQNIRDTPLRFRAMGLPGPIWSGYAPRFYPDPYSEWIDGPWGCTYSNIALHDWGTNSSAGDAITVVVTEADPTNNEDILGWLLVTPDMSGPILVKARMFGWVMLENITVDASGYEPSVDVGDVYWYGGWDGIYPEEVYGPQKNPAITCETCPGSQYRPFTDSQFWDFQNDARFYRYTVGLSGGKYPAGVLDKARIYKAVDKDRPAIFGEQ